jgi:hypothetical protein
MKVRIDAVIAEIARTLDVNLLRQDSNFETLPRPQRMHFIFRSLARCDIARAETFGGRKVRCWRPSRRLGRNFGVKWHGFPDELERIERPVAISTLADEFEELLQASGELAEDVADYVLRLLAIRLCT